MKKSVNDILTTLAIVFAPIASIIGWLFFAIFIFLGLSYVAPELCGSYDLGKGLYLIDWDGSARQIVYGTKFDGRACIGGAAIIPSYHTGLPTDSVNTVEKVSHDSSWIIGKAVASSKYGKTTDVKPVYFIISKQFEDNMDDMSLIRESYISTYRDSLDFAEACRHSAISLDLSDTK